MDVSALRCALLFLLFALPSFSHAEKSFPHPVGFWMFDKTHEGTDLSGNGNDAVLYNTEWTSGPFGTPSRAMKFTGANDQSSRAEIPNVNRALSVTDSFTWLTYFKDFETSKDGPIFSLGNYASWGHIFWKCCNGPAAFHPRFDVRPNGDSAWNQANANFFPQDKWMQVAVTYDQPAGTIRIYQYEEERVDLRGSYSGLLDDQWDKVYLGAVPPDSRELHASIFCTMYFGDALTREQISAAFSLCRPPEAQSLYPWPSPIAHWPMNSYHGVNNAADGQGKDGVASYYSLESGPDGEKGGSFYFRQSRESEATIDNSNGKLDINSFTFSAWIKPGANPGPIFRMWYDESGANNAPHIWTYPGATQFYFAHYSQSGGGTTGASTSPVGTVNLFEWNYVAVVYDYGQGKIYLYTNDVLRATTSVGSHPTRMGPVLAMVNYQDSSKVWGRDTRLACVQWFGDPLSSHALSKIKNECSTAKKSYKPSPTWIFPFSASHGLRDTTHVRREATASGPVEFVEGARKRPNEAMLLAKDVTVTMPTASGGELSSFSVALHLEINSGMIITLLDNIVTASQQNITVRFGAEVYQYSNLLTEELQGEIIWLGVVYEGELGVLTIYIDGNPVKVEYIGHHTITLSAAPVISNTGVDTRIQCYQVYKTALNLRQFVHTRDACIIYGSPSSLPYPRGFWPMNNRYKFQEITGRSPDLIPLLNNDILFDRTGPYGEPNSAAHFPRSNPNATLYMLNHRGLDVKFSMTVSAWVKCYSTFNERLDMFAWRALHTSEWQDRGDRQTAGTKLLIRGDESDNLGMYIVLYPTNYYITNPERTDTITTYAPKFKREEWVHIAVVTDFQGKTSTVYINGEEGLTKRTSRHILKTFYPVMVGDVVKVNDNGGFYAADSNHKTDHSMSCLQLYDVALSKIQVEQTMKLCNTDVLSSMFSKNPLVGDGVSNTSPDSTVTARSKAECALRCSADDSCESIGFRNSECHLSNTRREQLSEGSFAQTGKEYLEKEKTPWRLFV